jgi:hypothetical protein
VDPREAGHTARNDPTQHRLHDARTVLEALHAHMQANTQMALRNSQDRHNLPPEALNPACGAVADARAVRRAHTLQVAVGR